MTSNTTDSSSYCKQTKANPTQVSLDVVLSHKGASFFVAEVLQFDAMDSCPRYLAIAVEDYEGPFSDAQTIGIAEVDFLKYTTEGLNDLWVYLEGEKVRGTGARLHLKVALNNENATEAGTRTRHLAEIVEQETGKKVRVHSLFAISPPLVQYIWSETILVGPGRVYTSSSAD